MQFTRSTLGTLPKGPEFLQALQEDRLNQLRAQQAQQELLTAPVERQRAQEEVQTAHTQNLANTQAGDIAAWHNNPAYQKSWAQEPAEYRQHFISEYGPAASQAAGMTNQQTRTETGNPMTGLNIPEGQGASVELGGGVTANIKSPTVPAALVEEAGRLGVPVFGRTPDQVSQDIDAGYVTQGRIPEKFLPYAQKMAEGIKNHPVLGPYVTQREAYDEVKDGFQNPSDGGFGDMAMTEGMQRLANPRAAVRQGTIKNMQEAAGWAQQLDPSFDYQHAVQGNKFSPEARKRLMDITDKLFQTATARAGSALAAQRNYARSIGIPNADKFVDTVIGQTTGLTSESPTDQTQQPAAASTQANQGGVTTVNNQSDYDALPSGANYVDSNGSYRTKK